MLKKVIRKILNKCYKKVKTVKDEITKKVIAITKADNVLYDLDYKVPIHTIKRYGCTFHIKDVDAIVSGDKAALVVSEVAAVYKTSQKYTYVIAVDNVFKKLSNRTKQFVLEHEIAHVVHGLDNPKNKLSIETKVDLLAARKMKMNNIKLRKCLREIRDNCNYLSSKKIMLKRIKNIAR